MSGGGSVQVCERRVVRVNIPGVRGAIVYTGEVRGVNEGVRAGKARSALCVRCAASGGAAEPKTCATRYGG